MTSHVLRHLPTSTGRECPAYATSRPLSTELDRVRDRSLLVQNPNKLLDPFKRLLILFAGIHNAVPITLQRFRFHFAQAAGKERRSNGLGTGVQSHNTPPLAIEP